jgi:hypothetical protein
MNKQQTPEIDWMEAIDSQRFHPKNVIPLIVRYPKGEDKNTPLGGSIRSIMTIHALSISDIPTSFKYSMDRNQVDFKQPANVRFEIGEKYGRAVQYMAEKWAHVIESTRRSVAAFLATADGRDRDWFDACSFDILFIEPDATHTTVVCAWLLKNAILSEFIGVPGARDIQASEKVPTPCVLEIAGELDRDARIMALAQEEFSKLTVTDTGYANRMKFVDQIAKSLPGVSASSVFDAAVDVAKRTQAQIRQLTDDPEVIKAFGLNQNSETATVNHAGSAKQIVPVSNVSNPDFVSAIVVGQLIIDVGMTVHVDAKALTDHFDGADADDTIILVELVSAIMKEEYADWSLVAPLPSDEALLATYASFTNLQQKTSSVLSYRFDSSGLVEIGHYAGMRGNVTAVSTIFKQITIQVTRLNKTAISPKARLSLK